MEQRSEPCGRCLAASESVDPVLDLVQRLIAEQFDLDQDPVRESAHFVDQNLSVAKISFQTEAVRTTDGLRFGKGRDSVVQAVQDVTFDALDGNVQVVEDAVPFPVGGVDQGVPHRFLALDESCEVCLEIGQCHGSASHLVTLVAKLRECIAVQLERRFPQGRGIGVMFRQSVTEGVQGGVSRIEQVALHTHTRRIVVVGGVDFLVGGSSRGMRVQGRREVYTRVHCR